jgi:hypothetical protein
LRNDYVPLRRRVQSPFAGHNFCAACDRKRDDDTVTKTSRCEDDESLFADPCSTGGVGCFCFTGRCSTGAAG